MDYSEKTPLMTGQDGSSDTFQRSKTLGEDAKVAGSSWRYFWKSMIREHSHRRQAIVFRTVISSLIVLDMVSFVLQSDAKLATQYELSFAVLETVSAIVFFVEYVLRVWFAPERHVYQSVDPWMARVSWICSVEGIIDLLSFAPWILEQLGGVSMPNFMPLRVVRLFRLLKSHPVMDSFDLVARVVVTNKEILAVAFLICAVMMICMATLLYYLRPEDNEDFSSIMATMYLAVMMLTGQGQPDGDLPWYTKLIVIMTSIFAVAQFAIPASMLTWGFEIEAQRLVLRRHKQAKKRASSILKGGLEEWSSSSSDDDDRVQEWEEYEKVIAGGDDSDEDDNNASFSLDNVRGLSALSWKEQMRATRVFSAFDSDGDNLVHCKTLCNISSSVYSLEELTNPSGNANFEDYMAWLVRIKVNSAPHVFDYVLSKLEEAAAKPGTAATRAEGVADASERREALNTTPTSERLRVFLHEYEALEQEVSRLRIQNQALEEENKRLKRLTDS
eukprot:TRINITY_DN44459_c0_g1_i1.p1 TRINITY_DN44459_c0_g1~~TRINITY_DN44459_c0_g1_i1.p1  ORF type:complete len:502 (+),score=78.18 TRINITY_DN44459_c0_g1_i1:50-1555(+)